MTAPNLFIVYVADAERATAFYADLFDLEPVFVTPRYVAFEIAPGAHFAVWSGHADALLGDPARTSEVCITVPGGGSDVDAIHDAWVAKGVRIVQAPADDVFGRTFVAADPDGNLVRVAPTD